MKILPLLIGLLPIGLLLVCGIAIKYYKAYWLISGYNTMSQEEKKNVDIEGLGKIMANFCFVLGRHYFAGDSFNVTEPDISWRNGAVFNYAFKHIPFN